jgi:hypothetical protein
MILVLDECLTQKMNDRMIAFPLFPFLSLNSVSWYIMSSRLVRNPGMFLFPRNRRRKHNPE